MGSTRLPGKVLKKIEDMTLLEHCVRRVSEAKTIDKIVIATTIDKTDDHIEKLCCEIGVDCFRGSINNVLDRYYQCSLKYSDYQAIVRVTSDCPLIDPNVIDMCVEAFNESECDYISNVVPGERTFPRGLDTEVFLRDALEKAHQDATEDFEKEHVTPYIWQNKGESFKIGEIIIAPLEYKSDYRLTVDYLEDFSLMEKIYQEFYRHGEIIDVRDVIKFLDSNPKVAKINANCEQKSLK